MTYSEINALAVKHYGLKHQMVKYAEELSEADTAIIRLVLLERDYDSLVKNLVEEIADVLNMSDQIMDALHIRSDVLKLCEEKIQRLRVTIAKEQREK